VQHVYATLSCQSIMRILLKLLLPCAFFAMPNTVGAVDAPRQLIITQLSALSFGTFTLSGSGGSVGVDAGSGACRPSGVVMIRNFCEAGRVEIRGEPQAELLVEIVPSGVAKIGRASSRERGRVGGDGG